MASRKRSRELNLPPNNNSMGANNFGNNANTHGNSNRNVKRAKIKGTRFANQSNERVYNRNLPPSTVSAPAGLRMPVATKPGHQVNLPERSINNIFKAGITRKRKVPTAPAASIIQPPTFVFPNPNPALPRFGNAPPVQFNWNSALAVKATNASIRNRFGNPLALTQHRALGTGSGGKRKTRNKRTHTKK